MVIVADHLSSWRSEPRRPDRAERSAVRTSRDGALRWDRIQVRQDWREQV